MTIYFRYNNYEEVNDIEERCSGGSKNGPSFTVLYCNVLYSTVMYCTVLYRTVLYCTVLYCTVPYCTVLYGRP